MNSILNSLPVFRPLLRAGRRFAFGALADVVLQEWRVRTPLVRCACGRHELLTEQARLPLSRPLTFIYRSGYRARGSVRLRVAQLASAVKATVSNPEFVKVVTEDHPLLRSSGEFDAVWTKSALTANSVRAIRRMAEDGRRVFLDFVDGTDIPELSSHVHGYLCASRTELNHRTSFGQEAFYVPHGVDSRIRSAGFERLDFRIGYFGRPWMAEHLEALAEIVTVPAQESLSNGQFQKAMMEVRQWSHHYSARSYFGESNFKPPTKVFVAARSGSVFVGSRDDEEVVLLLGNDYPYLAEDSSFAEVKKMIEFARASFLAKEWFGAIEAMEGALQESCDETIGQRLLTVLQGPC